MKKIIITAVICIMLLINMSVPAFAYNYQFSSGYDYDDSLGKSTSTDALADDDSITANIRRNKDASYNPPTYGSGSGDIPTDYSSLYHNNSTQTATYSEYNFNGNGTSTANPQELPPVSNGGILTSTSVYSENAKILPIYYSDGSIGTFEFPRFNKTIKLYEGETLENMLFGAGHFGSTSAWDGNVAAAAHNRGVVNNFGFLADIDIGDKVIYTTKYGIRTYKVTEKTQISETDTSGLTWSNENVLSLYTCVKNIAGVRIYVRCMEVKE